ncbi:type II secretion system F domain-containing protein [Pseudomonas sp. BAY1663]|uniref:type II secretion system F family protein n=1 Tax=Pseudomonas sp. BAY1663 TaxID=1439940 RepID=UPI00042DF281|nr:type II secretion system F family protein [Pseudomonas sp. BAY1663]EXF45587.1 type II secretion system F domain-containing protein [Pseudomonas sp. BAY1663]
MNGPTILSVALLLAAAVLLVSNILRQHWHRRQVVERLGVGGVARGARLLHELDSGSLVRRARSLDPEVRQLLDRLGWRQARQRTLFLVIQFGLPLLLAGLAVLAGWLAPGAQQHAWLAPLFALGIGYLVPKRLLARAAAARQARLALEISTAIPLLRILFEVGMTVEQALRVLAAEGQGILPELAAELQQALQRVDAGLELGQELRYVAALVDVDEVTDCFVILEQLIQQGGGAMASLLTMKRLIDDRRMSALQEKVSKLSAKMSVVMITFLFPALLIVLAGPGFIAIIRALGEIG